MAEVKSELEQLYNQSIKVIREGQVVQGKIGRSFIGQAGRGMR